MTPEEFIKLIDDEIAACEELWAIYDEEGDREKCKRIMSNKVSFDMFKRKVLKRLEDLLINRSSKFFRNNYSSFNGDIPERRKLWQKIISMMLSRQGI